MSPDKKAGIPGLSNLINMVRGSQPQEVEETPDAENAEVSKTFLIVGLGNPGKEYAGNRHNIGFMVLDHLADKLGVRFSKMQARALVADTRYGNHRLLLVKPQTFMNESGQSVASLQKFYKMPLSQVIVIFDDMDLPMGKIRIRPKGGSSGQNGMKSIIQRLSNNHGFPRIRLGIDRPPGHMRPPDYLLQDFTKDQVEILDGLLDETANAVLAFVSTGLDSAMNQFNSSEGKND
jgi:PTH1 family peptidyl-tRNA hydrolase